MKFERDAPVHKIPGADGKKSIREAILFVFTGALNTLIGYGFFFLLVTLSVPYTTAYTVSTIAGVVINYFTYSGLVFKKRGRREALLFAVVYAIIYFVGIALLRALVGAGFEPRVAGALNVLPTTVLSFALQKAIVFGRLWK